MPYKIYIAIACVSLVTFLIRTLPVLFLAHRDIPGWFSNILLFIPTAILTTITITELIYTQSESILGVPIAFPAAILTFIISYISKNLSVAVLSSIISYFALQHM